MLPKRKRLTTEAVKEVLARGKSRRGSYLSLKTLNTTTPFRCSVVVSKKVASSAVRRNTLRRAVYQALSQTSLPPTGHAILFVQSAPPKDLVATFNLELNKILHV